MGLPFNPMLSGFSHLNTWEYIGLRKSLLPNYSELKCTYNEWQHTSDTLMTMVRLRAAHAKIVARTRGLGLECDGWHCCHPL